MDKFNINRKAYIACDKDGSLYLYLSKPVKSINCWRTDNMESIDLHKENVSLPPNCTPKWEDENPIECNLTISLIK